MEEGFPFHDTLFSLVRIIFTSYNHGKNDQSYTDNVDYEFLED